MVLKMLRNLSLSIIFKAFETTANQAPLCYLYWKN